MRTESVTSDGLGRLLLSLRCGAGLSQEELAAAAGISVRALADLERGRTRGPQRRTVQALAAALGLDPACAEQLEQAAKAGRPRPRQQLLPAADSTVTQVSGLLALPRDIGDFTARGPALSQLHALVDSEHPAHPPVAVVSGQPGLGKTAFAVHAAHELADRFPDGVFAIDLRGMEDEPTSARDALARLLGALGVAESEVPAGTDDRAGLYRSLVGERRILLVLDNAVDEDQVRPLLPGSGSSLTIVTSRRALAGIESVHRIALAVLKREEAVELLTRIIGPQRVRREEQAVRDLADLCGHLPLAVRIAGQRLAVRPEEHVGKLVARLAEESRRLDSLQAGGLQVRAAFALSYQQLSPSSQLLFRRATLAAGPDFSPESAALLTGLPAARAALCAEELTDAGLLQPDSVVERYRFHDLLKLFATEQLGLEDGPQAVAEARDRLVHWMLARATAAALRFDAERHAEDPVDDPDPASAPADRAEARGWLEAERSEWMAALRQAQAAGRHQQVIDAAEAMHWFSDVNHHWELWVEVFTLAVDSARVLGSRRDEAVHLNYLSWAYSYCLNDNAGALAAADRACAVAREIGDALQIGWALGYSAGALRRLGRTEESIHRFQDAAARLAGEDAPPARLAELSVLNALGRGLRESGRVEEALVIHLRGAELSRQSLWGQAAETMALYHALALLETGNDLAALGRWAEAEGPLREAVEDFESLRAPAWSEPARLDLGLVLRRLTRYDEAHETLLAARGGLSQLKSPRQEEAAAALRAVEQFTTGGR
ncbi:helix-turn-helix domain-containing protein [Streptomyces sp. NPDC005195]|uniref:ATP-binding protein n=1 Tax=Streptomyces sp. NPDC005195 TaxID=3154561 RepID=UPI0033BA6D9F